MASMDRVGQYDATRPILRNRAKYSGSVTSPSQMINMFLRKTCLFLLIAENGFDVVNVWLPTKFTCHIPFVEGDVFTNAFKVLH